MKNVFLIILSFYFFGCASFLSQSESTKKLLRQNQVAEAINNLKQKASEAGKDQLVYALDYATVLQISGDYKASANAFIKADQLTEEKDYHSISQIAGSAIGAEEMIQYKGESYEKFLINSLNAINYLMLGDYDSALVECRRINSKISSFKMEGRESYELSSFASYLSAIIWESQKKYDDAYIDYKAAYKLDPYIPNIDFDLIRSAKLSGRTAEVDKWRKTFADFDLKKITQADPRNSGELIVIFQQGFGAKKVPRIDEPRFPTLKADYLQTITAQIELTPLDVVNKSLSITDKTKTVYDIDRMAVVTMTKDYNSLVARRLGGLAAKAVVSDQIRQKDELLGAIAWIAMNIADRADLRQWSTLPSKIQMTRLFLKPGKYELKINGLDENYAVTTDQLPGQVIEIKAGKKTFVNFRSLR